MSRLLIIDPSLNVVDSQSWLRKRIEALIDARDYSSALTYLEKLEAASPEPAVKWYVAVHRGLIGLGMSDVPLAKEAFQYTLQVAPGVPEIHYALGHCAQLQRNNWQATLHFFEAIHTAGSAATMAEYMRSAGLALLMLGYSDLAHSLFWGAHERDPSDPWVLETLSQYYARSEQWLDTIDVLESLIDALQSPALDNSLRFKVGAHDDQPFAFRIREHLYPFSLSADIIRERVRSINDRMRNMIDMAHRRQDISPLESTGLTAVNFPAALHILVREMENKPRNYQLLETAQSLWARAHHERFDVFLTPNVLAATIHWITERLHWRHTTQPQELATLYQVNPETVQAALRIVVERFEISYFPHAMTYLGLTQEDVVRLSKLQRALLYDVNIATLESEVVMLGG